MVHCSQCWRASQQSDEQSHLQVEVRGGVAGSGPRLLAAAAALAVELVELDGEAAGGLGLALALPALPAPPRLPQLLLLLGWAGLNLVLVNFIATNILIHNLQTLGVQVRQVMSI